MKIIIILIIVTLLAYTTQRHMRTPELEKVNELEEDYQKLIKEMTAKVNELTEASNAIENELNEAKDYSLRYDLFSKIKRCKEKNGKS